MKYNTFQGCEEQKLQEWTHEIAANLPHLSWAQCWGLALWTFGMMLAQSCGLTTVASYLAGLLSRKESNLKQQLREWYCEAEHKKGNKRAELNTSTCFKPLLRWILRHWADDEKRLALAMDATCLGDRFTILAISVVYRGCAIPVAWKIVLGQTEHAWKPEWLVLFETLRGAVPEEWTVIVMADRGLYAKWLFEKIVSLKWHPFLRVNLGGQFQVKGQQRWRELREAAPKKGQAWCGEVHCFKSHPLECTLLAGWDEPHTDPWLIVTDLVPEQTKVCWYSMRFWIERGFKHNKRGGWQWQNTRQLAPARAERIWLAMAVATLWVVRVGGEAELALPASSLSELPESHIARRSVKAQRRSKPRVVGIFKRGLMVLLLNFSQGRKRGLGGFVPEAWPDDYDWEWISLETDTTQLTDPNEALLTI